VAATDEQGDAENNRYDADGALTMAARFLVTARCRSIIELAVGTGRLRLPPDREDNTATRPACPSFSATNSRTRNAGGLAPQRIRDEVETAYCCRMRLDVSST
jgi:hypothetical protein